MKDSGSVSVPAAPVRRALRRARGWRAFYGVGLTLARFAVFLAAGCLLLAALDGLRPLPQDLRRLLWAGLAAAAAGAAVLRARIWTGWRARELALHAGRGLRPADGLLNAWELSRRPSDAGISGELVERTLAEAAARARGLSLREALRPPETRVWSAAALSALAAAALGLGLLPDAGRAALRRAGWPFGPENVPGLSVRPGDARFVRGGSVAVQAALSRPGPAEPELWIRAGTLRWERRPFQPVGRGEYRALLRDLREPVSYRVRYRGRWTPAYRLAPYDPPRFISFRAELRFPRYTGRSPEAVEDALTWRAIRGTRILFRGRLDRAVARAAAVLDDGRSLEAEVRGKDVSLALEAVRPAELQWLFEAPDLPGPDRSSPPVRIEIAEDEPPTVRVLSPAQDLLISPGISLPVAYEVSDDFGVAAVSLRYAVNGGPGRTVPWESFAPAAERGTFDRAWPLRPLGLQPGDTIRWWLTARDNNPFAPGGSDSAAFVLRVASYERDRAEAERVLAEVRRKLVDALAEQSLLREGLNAAPPDWAALQARQAALFRALQAQAAALESALRRMERDPLADQAEAAEYGALAGNLRDLAGDALSRAQAGLAAREAPSAGRAMDEAVSELERMSVLAEEAAKSKRMREILARQEDLAGSAQAVAEGLAARPGRALSPEEREEIRRMLEEMAEAMDAIARQVRDLPRELPEDFVNQQGVKTLRFDRAQALMAEVEGAIARGDAAGALAAARQLLQQVRDIQNVLEKAAKGVSGGSGWFGGEMTEEMSRRGRELESLIGRQEELKSRSQSLSAAAIARMQEEGKRLLARLESEWSPSASALDGLLPEFAAADPGLAAESAARLQRAAALSREARGEFASRRLENSPRGLQELNGHLDALLQGVARARGPTVPQEAAAGLPPEAKARREALDRLEKKLGAVKEAVGLLRSGLASLPPEESFLTESEKQAAGRRAAEQDGLRKDALELRSALQSFSRRTALVGSRLIKPLTLAASAMADAGKDLAAARPRDAVRDQETALRHLRSGSEELQQTLQQASSLGGGAAGRPMARPVQSLGGAGASGGVALPKASDYRPPREFREDLLKSMKEKYPKSYEKIIQDYYKNWAR